MKKIVVLAFILACLIAGQGIMADDIVISPTIIAAVDRIGEAIEKLPPGSVGLFGPVQTSIGEEFALKITEMLETRLKQTVPGITLLNSLKARKILGLKADGHYTGDQIKGFLSTLGGPEWWLAGRIDDDGKFYIDSYAIEGFIGSFENEDDDLGIPFEQDELFKLVTDIQVPSMPNYTLVQLNGEVYKTAYSQEGDQVLITTAGGGIYVYNTYTRRMVQTIRDEGAKTIPVFGPGDQLLLAEDTGILRIVDGKKETEIKIADSPLSAISVSSRGNIYIGFNGGIEVYDSGKKIRLLAFENVSGKVMDLFLSSDEQTVIAQDSHGISLWNASDGKKIYTIPNTADVKAFAVDKTGEIAFAKQNKLYMFSQKTKKQSDAFKAPGQPGIDSEITALHFSPNGAYVVSGHKSGLTVTWHTTYLLGMHALDNHLGAISSISYRNDGSQYITGGLDSQIFFYDGAPAEPSGNLKVVNDTTDNVTITINAQRPKEGPVIPAKTTRTYSNIPLGNTEVVIYNPPGVIIDASRMRTASINMTKNGNTITLTKQATPPMDFDTDGRVTPSSLSIVPNSKSLTITTKASEPTKSDSGRASIVTLNYENGTLTTIGSTNEQHRKNINASVWCGDLFITAGEEGVWLWQNNKFEAVLDNERCENLSVSADKRYLLSSSRDGGSKLWDLQARTLLRQLPGASIIDGESILSIISNGCEIIRQSFDGAKLPVFPFEGSNDETITITQGVASIRPGFGGSLLVARSDNFIEVRNAGRGTPLIFSGTMAVQNSKGLLAVNDSGGEIKTYNLETGFQQGIVFAHSAVITDMVFLTDDLLATASRDGSTKITNIATSIEYGKFGIFDDKQRVYIRDDTYFGDSLHVLKNGKRL